MGGEVYALSEMVDHMLLLLDFREPFEGANPGAVGLEDCASSRTRLRTKKIPGTPLYENSAGHEGR